MPPADHELTALALLCRLFATAGERRAGLCGELLHFLRLAWVLDDAQLSWCRETLAHPGVPAGAERAAVHASLAVLRPPDVRRLERGLRWIDALSSYSNDRFWACWYEVCDGEALPSEDKQTLEAFFVLGIEPTFDARKLRSAFRDQMLLLHPDRLVGLGLGPEESRRAEGLVKDLNRARARIERFYASLAA